MNTNPIIIVEIPHQREAFAWTAYGWSDAADRSSQQDGQSAHCREYTLDEALETFDEDSEPVDIAKEHGSVVQVIRRPNEDEYFAPGTEPDFVSVIKDWIKHDLNSAFFLNSADEFTAFLRDYTGHQENGAKAAAEKEATRLGWFTPKNDDENYDELWSEMDETDQVNVLNEDYSERSGMETPDIDDLVKLARYSRHAAILAELGDRVVAKKFDTDLADEIVDALDLNPSTPDATRTKLAAL